MPSTEAGTTVRVHGRTWAPPEGRAVGCPLRLYLANAFVFEENSRYTPDHLRAELRALDI